MAFDPRLLRVGVEISGQLRWYEDVQIAANITKTANPLQNEALVKITNMNKSARDYILTETSPFNKNPKPKKIIVEGGRVSTGMFRLFEGNITVVTPSQPPDIVLTFKCKTGEAEKTNIVSRSAAAQAPLSTLAAGIAKDLNLSLIFEATDKNISNFNHTGAALRQVDKLSQMGNVNAYVDDDKLIVKNFNRPLIGVSHTLSLDNGMIGIPEITDQGIKVTYFLDPQSKLGGELNVVSRLYPAATGKYCIYKMTLDLANRDTPFYTIAEAKRS